jgi:spermidine/putrescine transport system permease protein
VGGRGRLYRGGKKAVRKNYGPVYTAPIALWISVFFVVPIAIIFLYSFLKKGLYGGIVFEFSLEAYRALLNPAFLKVALTTFVLSVAATAATLLLALPTAYFIARSRHKTGLLLLVIIPFWTNFLIRIYAWIAILGNNGFLNNALAFFGISKEPLQLMYNPWAVVIVLVYTYLPFAILPLYSAIEKFDFALLEAARDLGATMSQSIFKVLLPNIKTGITTAILFTFIPAFGQYAIPQIVGGKDSFMVGNIIARELTVTRNWPLSSSISMALTLVTTLGVLLFLRFSRSAVEKKRG